MNQQELSQMHILLEKKIPIKWRSKLKIKILVKCLISGICRIEKNSDKMISKINMEFLSPAGNKLGKNGGLKGKRLI